MRKERKGKDIWEFKVSLIKALGYCFGKLGTEKDHFLFKIKHGMLDIYTYIFPIIGQWLEE